MGGAGDNHYFLQQLERRHTNAGREGKGARANDYYYFFFSGGGQSIIITFFLFGGVPEIRITSCNSWKGATPTLGGRERGEGNRLLLPFFSLGGGQSMIITFLGFLRVGWAGGGRPIIITFFFSGGGGRATIMISNNKN